MSVTNAKRSPFKLITLYSTPGVVFSRHFGIGESLGSKKLEPRGSSGFGLAPRAGGNREEFCVVVCEYKTDRVKSWLVVGCADLLDQ